jgi:endo-1,4-beta-xylanase
MNDRRWRAIDGFSMGGFGALMYAAKRTDLFSAVVGYAGALADWPGLIPSIRQEMYNNVQANFTPYSVWDLTALNHELMRTQLDMLMICGAADTLLARNRQYNEYLESLGIDVPLHEIPGVGHDGAALFSTGLGLAFLDQHFRTVGGPIHGPIFPKGFDNTVLLPEPASMATLVLLAAAARRRRRRTA